MTNRLDRLERAGLVTRLPDPDDGRRVLVRLTEQGRDHRRGDGRPHRRRSTGCSRCSSEPERLALEDHLRLLLSRLEPDRDGDL
jgi:DNA-binding MarR family transcriptional regulator